MTRFIHLLGELFSRADLARIERALARLPRPAAREIELTCTLRRAANAIRLDLDCAGGDEVKLDRAGLNYGWPDAAYGME